ncbi:MAG: hypothetical protein WBA22_04445 [Candidatus Methanofastidiosia archaeon]
MLIYRGCLEEVRKTELSGISEERFEQVIRTFLINWGKMGRVLPQGTGWEGKLTKSIRKNCPMFESMRTLNLRNTELPGVEDDIKQCYKTLRGDVGPTGVAKTLHLISPNFFPLWDTGIRKKVSKETSLKKRPIGDTAAGYYKFMAEIKEFLGRYGETLSRLSEECGWTELKIIDEYLLRISRASH